MKNSLRILALAVATLLIAAAFAGCGAKKAEEGTTLRVGMECAYAPFNWTQNDDSNGAVPIEGGGFAGGYDVEMAKKIADGLGRELVIVKTEWDGLEPAVSSGKIDAIIAGMSNNPDRATRVDFTDNYYTSNIVVVVKKEGPYAEAKSIHDFVGAKITGQLSTLHYDFIDQMEGVEKQAAMEDFPTMVVAVSSGKIDGYTTELPGARSAVATNPDLMYIEFAEGNGFDVDIDEVSVAVALKKGSDLRDPINEILKGIGEDERNTLMDEAVKNQPSAE